MAEQEKAQSASKALPDDQSPRRNEGQQEQGQNWFVKNDEGVAVQSTPEEDRLPEHMQGWPEGDKYVGLAQAKLQNPVEAQERQRAEAYPRMPQMYFDPEEHMEDRELYVSMAGTCFVTVDHELVHDGRAILSGYQELPKDIAQYLVSEGLAYEPAGQKPN